MKLRKRKLIHRHEYLCVNAGFMSRIKGAQAEGGYPTMDATTVYVLTPIIAKIEESNGTT